MASVSEFSLWNYSSFSRTRCCRCCWAIWIITIYCEARLSRSRRRFVFLFPNEMPRQATVTPTVIFATLLTISLVPVCRASATVLRRVLSGVPEDIRSIIPRSSATLLANFLALREDWRRTWGDERSSRPNENRNNMNNFLSMIVTDVRC